jgi:hypothetical protein
MGQPLFGEISSPLSALLEQIAQGQIALPDLQRPFVWPNKKVRDLLDSMYRGYPVGYLLLWENGAVDGHIIGPDRKAAAPHLLLIDGQQRLTSLYAVLRGEKVKRENFQEEHIQIAFQPLEEQFEVTDAAIRKNPRWIPDVSAIWTASGGFFEVVEQYLAGLSSHQEVTPEDRRRIQQNLQGLFQLNAFPFTALRLSRSLDEEQVAEVFVRVNSQGTPLNQADFILTLMSVFRDNLRRDLEQFCRQCRQPAPKNTPSPFNYFLVPDPEHLLRVAVGLGFRRARLKHVYSILRGKDLETGEFSASRRDEQFSVLAAVQSEVLNLQHWHEFLKTLEDAGYRSGQLVSSRNAILYCYVYFLIARRDYRLSYRQLAPAIARWFFFVALTGRYTDSPETRMEQDLADLREVHSGSEFLQYLDKIIRATFTPDYWQMTLPSELATSSAQSPGLFGYYAALVLLDARALLSKKKVAQLLNPAIHAQRSAIERHHLFPKAWLRQRGITSVRDTNQAANYALADWVDNGWFADRSPAEYFPEAVTGLSADEREQQAFWHALPPGWETMDYSEFLGERRRRMAAVIRAGFELLCREATRRQPGDKPAERSDSGKKEEAEELSILADLPEAIRAIFQPLLEEPEEELATLVAEVRSYTEEIEREAAGRRDFDSNRGQRLAERCLALLERGTTEAAGSESKRLIQAAVRYFLLRDDAERDQASVASFLDDELVLNAVEMALSPAPSAAPPA